MFTNINARKIGRSLRELLKNNSGNIAPMMGMAAIPLFISLGAAIDTVRAAREQTAFQAAVDTAALAIAADALSDYSGLSEAVKDARTVDLKLLAKNFIAANYVSSTGEANDITVDLDINGLDVNLTAHHTFPTAIMSLVGVNTVSLNTGSFVKKSGSNLEVSLVLDNTNSMNSTNPKTGNTAIADLKTSAAKFVDQVMPATQGLFYTKIAAIPYGNGVNLGSRAVQVRGGILAGTSTTSGSSNFKFKNTSNSDVTLPISNCVTERTGAQAYTDASFSANPVGRAYLPTANACQVQEVVGLTTNSTTLKATISAMTAGGSTAGQVGIAWGWYTLSPSVGLWTGISQPAGYDKLSTNNASQKVKKIMILMTDGEYNSANNSGVIAGNPFVTGTGSAANQINLGPTNGDSYAQSNTMCAAIKASGVEVYVVTFQLDKSVAKRVSLVNNCASDAGHVLDADSTSLDTAFNSIANSIQAMRLAQ